MYKRPCEIRLAGASCCSSCTAALEAVAQGKLDGVQRSNVARVVGLERRLEREDTLRRRAVARGRYAGRQCIAGVREQDRGAADRAAGGALIREGLLAPVLVEQVAEVDHVHAELQVLELLAADLAEGLCCRDVDLVDPRVA